MPNGQCNGIITLSHTLLTPNYHDEYHMPLYVDLRGLKALLAYLDYIMVASLSRDTICSYICTLVRQLKHSL